MEHLALELAFICNVEAAVSCLTHCTTMPASASLFFKKTGSFIDLKDKMINSNTEKVIFHSLVHSSYICIRPGQSLESGNPYRSSKWMAGAQILGPPPLPADEPAGSWLESRG